MTIKNIELDDLEPGAMKSNDKVASNGIDLIKNVKVKLMVHIGDAELSVQELFELTENSVVKLDRDLEAPVDITLDGKVIARGTLVAVADNFGIKITEINNNMER